MEPEQLQWCQEWLQASSYMISEMGDKNEFTEERLTQLIEVEARDRRRMHLIKRLIGRRNKLSRERELDNIRKGLHMAKDKEGIVEDYLVAKIEALDGRCEKVIFKKGFPDRMCIMPYGVVAFCETKTETGQLKPWQRRWIIWLGERGHLVSTCHSKSQVDLFVGSLKREIKLRMQRGN